MKNIIEIEHLNKSFGEIKAVSDLSFKVKSGDMEEAADADYVVILDSGIISAEGTPLNLKNTYAGDFVTLYNTEEEKIKQLGAPYEKIKDAYRISVPGTAAATEMILKNPEIFNDYEIMKGKMDDVFLAATGKKLTGGMEK